MDWFNSGTQFFYAFCKRPWLKSVFKKFPFPLKAEGEKNGTPTTYARDNQLNYLDEKLPNIQDSLSRLISHLFGIQNSRGVQKYYVL